MLTTSAAFKTAIASEDREIRAYLKFNGSTILRGVDGLVSIEWDQSVYDEERLCIGCAVSSFITAEFFDNLTGVDFKNSYVEAFVGVVLEDTGTAPSGSIEPDTATVEYVSLGRFDITDSVTKNGKTVITAYDKLSKLSGEYTPSISAGTNGYAIADIVNDVLTQSGVGGSVSGSYGYVQKIQASTYREQLKYCLTMMVQNGSSYILDRTNDSLKMTSVIGQDATQLTITDSTTYIDGMDEQPSFTISSLQATTGTDVYTFGNGQGIEISNPYITNAQASAIYNSMEGFSYLPIRLEFRGNPAIDPGDVLTLTAGGKNTKIVAMRVRSTFNGGFKSTIDCYGNTETYYAMSESPTGTRITQAENMIRLEAERATTAEGNLSAQITINADAISSEVTRATEAEGNLSTRITQNAEGVSIVSEKLNNIGGRNYAWAMDPSIHARAYLQNCTLTYNPDNNGEYRIVGGSGANNQQAWYYGSGETGYAIPSELLGEKVIFHADYISATGTSATPQAYMVFYDSSDTNVGEYYLEPGDLSKTFTVPTTAIRMTPLLRVRQSGTFQSGEVLTVRSLKLEKGEVATDWTPAPEDGQAQVTSVRNEVTVNTEGITLLSEKIENIGGRNLLTNTSATEQTFTAPSSGYTDFRSWITTTALYKTTYTLSFWAKSTTAGDVITTHFYSPNVSTVATRNDGYVVTRTDGYMPFTLTTSWAKYWVTYEQASPVDAVKHVIGLRVYASEASGTISVMRYKFEEGSVPTDWTPAPEDKTSNNEIIAKINVSPENITISANKVDLQGYVTFTNLSTSGETSINGGNITTGLIQDQAGKNYWNLNTGEFKITDGSIDINSGSDLSSKISFTAVNTPNNPGTYHLGIYPYQITARFDGESNYINNIVLMPEAPDITAVYTDKTDNSQRVGTLGPTYLEMRKTGANYALQKQSKLGSDLFAMYGPTTSAYTALIWPDSNGAGRLILGDGSRTLWRTSLTNDGLTFRDSSDNVTASYPATPTTMSYNTSVNAITSRGSISLGGAYAWGNLIFVSLVFSASANASNSPQIATLPNALNDTALSAIDITSGIGSSIDSAVPCGVAANGKLYIKTITSGHIYAISGVYPHG